MIELNVNENEILSKLGSPKKVAQEIKQSFTEKNRDDVRTQGATCFSCRRENKR